MADAYWKKQDPDRATRNQVFEASREEYRNKFLRSPEWRELRSRVLKRAAFVCEACLIQHATDVHHLRYGLNCLPPAWDLRAVCRGCHEALHGAVAAWAGR